MRTRIGRWLLIGIITAIGIEIGLIMMFRVKPRRTMTSIRRFNRRVVNPIALRFAGSPGSPLGVIHHRGRASKVPYATPVQVIHVADGYLIPLPYGRHVDWLANICHAGVAVLDADGREVNVEHPDVMASTVAERRIPAEWRRQGRLYGITEYVHLREVEVPAGVPT